MGVSREGHAEGGTIMTTDPETDRQLDQNMTWS
jgi:hypothetical protein